MLELKKDEKDIWEYFKFCWKQNSYLKRIPLVDWEKAFQKGKLLFFSWKNKNFFRLNKEFRSYPLGTFFNEKLFVPGYPHIPRVYVLKTGLKRYLKYPFYAEEKIEGYNVRLVKVEDEILAFTRRGYVCPFATDRWEDFLPNLPEFFEENPDFVVCCEVAGPENPFVSEYPPYIKEDVNYFVFDFMEKGTGKFINISKKLKWLEKYNLNSPEINGPFDPERDYKEIKELLARYHLEKREGVVFKPEDKGSRVKYVTPFSNLEDLKVVFPYLGDIDPYFISLRLIRLALNLYEFEEFKEEVYNKLGPNMFEEILKMFNEDKPSQEIFKVRFKKESNYLAMLAHFRLAKVNVEIKRAEWKNGYLHIEFVKIYPKATQFWKSKLEGWGEVD
ncbi:RNA ligase [Thermodesulfobacterium hydrogeniphilum]|uniref:RNA ligase n=1 Tax=Thermodesulfobacterium hydrogeniphilum TaxID=161156 RepID=UPI00068EA87E|nr:RNA ligase [Thermodesulfobacterium hydrogeniphilum]